MRIGFIGLGLMGSGIARNILVAGHDLVVWNRTPEKAEPLRAAGATVARSIAEACDGREIVATMLADDAALLDVAAAMRDGLAPNAIHLVMGTHGVQAVREVAELHAAAGQVVVAGHVLGRPEAAAAAQLGIIAAGAPDAVEQCLPLFDAVGSRTFGAGDDPVGATAVKLANNFALGCAIESLAEAFALVRGYGLPAKTLYDILTQGLFAGSVAYVGYGQAMLEERFEPGMKVILALKDVDLIIEAAEAARVSLPSVYVNRATLAEAIERGDGERDWAVIARHLSRTARKQ
jgi:3-hydroxyisobutyrate dehydrogenase-like beta-hydroxyacid dehydrogenase